MDAVLVSLRRRLESCMRSERVSPFTFEIEQRHLDKAPLIVDGLARLEETRQSLLNAMKHADAMEHPFQCPACGHKLPSVCEQMDAGDAVQKWTKEFEADVETAARQLDLMAGENCSNRWAAL